MAANDSHPSFGEAELAMVRCAYARQVLAQAGVRGNVHLEHAFAAVRREDFLGPPPWRMATTRRYREIGDDPVVLYQDALFALDAENRFNNGSPSLHAKWLDALAPRAGDLAVHLGAGTGYYTAMLSRLVGAAGKVVAVEFEAGFAEAARRNLAELANVEVVHGDGGAWPRGPADRIYVNFGVERPMAPWLDQLREGGRLVFPLGRYENGRMVGGGFRVERRGDDFAARYLGAAFFVGDSNAAGGDEDYRARLGAAFEAGLARGTKSLVWRRAASTETCWFAGDDWGLSHDDIRS
ncbi:MAG: protein-L-isoaspartate O-methyltransferase family protein [Acidiphilium sp.]